MKPLFTLHAGEYLVGSHIERCYRQWNVWVPSKDTGIDLLVTDSQNRKAVSLQVKFSKDFSPTTRRKSSIKDHLMARGWWTLNEKKIRESKADFWVFVLRSFLEHRTSFIIIPQKELLPRLRGIHDSGGKRIFSYLCVTKSKRCWETRLLKNDDLKEIVKDRFSDERRDFSIFLNAWGQIEKNLK